MTTPVRLSDHFEAVASKRLSAVEADTDVSHQHEFNGTKALQDLFGLENRSLEGHFVYVGDDEDATQECDGPLTWYDARKAHPSRTEYRLYFQANPVSESMRPGDLLILARNRSGALFVIVAAEGSSSESQLRWLFRLPEPGNLFRYEETRGENDREIGSIVSELLSHLGIEVETAPAEDFLHALRAKFGERFPPTREFSALARETIGTAVSAVEDPDSALVAWLDREESLFLAFERHLVRERLLRGFATGGEADVDGFVAFSLSVQNRRKSRAGHSLENHIAQIFADNNLRFSRNQVTESHSRPDFVLPGIEEYRDEAFPSSRLTLLGVKSTCKDRWRQVLSEGDRVPKKHLLTLEPGISQRQTDEMKSRGLTLVMPLSVHGSYSESQRKRMLSVNDFLSLVRSRQ